jgi:hypothetical protein
LQERGSDSEKYGNQRSPAIMKTPRTHKPKDQAILISVAESIGSTLGALAAKADAAAGAAKQALSGHNNLTRSVKREGKVVRKARQASRNAKKSRVARTTGRTIRRAKRAVSRRAKAKK